MGQLLVRNLDDELVRSLKVRAARNGRSAEAEHRTILEQALREEQPTKTFKEFLLELPDVGDDELFERVQDLGRDVQL